MADPNLDQSTLVEQGGNFPAAIAEIIPGLSEHSENELLVVINSGHEDLIKLESEAFMLSVPYSDRRAYRIRIEHRSAVETAMNVGPRTLARVLRDVGIKRVSSPGTLLNVQQGKVRLPSNLESAADSLVYKSLILYSMLGIELEVTDQQVSIPEFSQGWATNMSYIYSVLLKIAANLMVDPTKREQLPAKMQSSVGKQIMHILVYKWASRKNLVAFLNPEVKKSGNKSVTEWLDLVGGWGTPCQGNLAQRIAASIYQILGIISLDDGISQMMNPLHFLTGSDLRKFSAPPKQILEKKGTVIKVVKQGEINVLRFDSIRFLLPKERVRAKEFNESADLEKQIRQFDRLAVKDRNYPQLLETIKAVVAENSIKYFKLRRLSRNRLYAIKEIRREAKQPDQINDTEFGNNEFIDSVCKQADAMIVDIDRRRSLKDRLLLDPISLTFASQQDEDDREEDQN